MSRVLPSPGSPSTRSSCPRPLLARSHAAANAASSAPRPPRAEPALEFARPGDGETLEEVPFHERRGPRPVVLRVPLGELVAVQCDRRRAEADLVAIGGHLIVAEDAAQHA